MKIEDLFKQADTILEDEKLREMFKKCFLSTLETSVKVKGDKTYIITGDINAMWLRDSSCQVNHYLKFIKDDLKLQKLIKGLIKAQVDYILLDPYANAFLSEPDVEREYHDTTIMKPYVWERKYELDSLCYPVKLTYQYYQETKNQSLFDEKYLHFIHTILNIIELEQKHSENSTYTFERDIAKTWDLRKTETLQNHGHGFDTRYTGMTWSAFRPSDDACTFNYNIPGNMFCSVILNYLREIVRDIYKDSYLEERIVDLKFQIDYGIELFGIVHHPQYGKMYAYETDGYGNHVLMDDANVPSLLSVPYLGFTDYQDEVYQNTRQFVLSHENPYYYEGTRAKGIGSPHTWPQYIWPIALSMQGLTSQNENEMKELIDMIMNNTGGTGVCHESFDVNDDSKYTRPWFCWANSLFAELVLKAYFKM